MGHRELRTHRGSTEIVVKKRWPSWTLGTQGRLREIHVRKR